MSNNFKSSALNSRALDNFISVPASPAPVIAVPGDTAASKRFTVELSAEQYKALRVAAAYQGRVIRYLIADALTAYLAPK